MSSAPARAPPAPPLRTARQEKLQARSLRAVQAHAEHDTRVQWTAPASFCEKAQCPGGETLRRLPVQALVKSKEAYDALYKRSVEDPAAFWGEIAREFHWRVPALAAPARAFWRCAKDAES